jgi:hypothetical protein
MFDVEITTSDLDLVSFRRDATIQSRNTNSCHFDLLALLACVISYANPHFVIRSNRLHENTVQHSKYSEAKCFFFNPQDPGQVRLRVFLVHPNYS